MFSVWILLNRSDSSSKAAGPKVHQQSHSPTKNPQQITSPFCKSCRRSSSSSVPNTKLAVITSRENHVWIVKVKCGNPSFKLMGFLPNTFCPNFVWSKY
jgi:hypothetical protein